MNKCEWKEELVDGDPGKYVKTGLVFHPCEDFSILYGNNYFNEDHFVTVNYCPSCGADIRKPEPVVKDMTCDSECGMRMKYGVSCEHHDCKMIRPTEPTKPLIVKSGETWVAYWEDVDYISIQPDFYKKHEVFFIPCQTQIEIHPSWKSFTGDNPDITELSDEIAKLRPMCRFISSDSQGQGLLIWKNILVYMDENDYMTSNGTSHSGCKLLTAKELQEAE